MAQSRAQLHSLLKAVLGSDNVYFQPPPSKDIVYPCIVYQRDSRTVLHADNKPYKDAKRYTVTVIDRNPDSDIPDKVADLPYCRHDRFFAADQLNHDVFQLFY